MNYILRKQIYAGLFEIIKDRNLYHHSTVGKEYSHLTAQGKEAVIKWLDLMAWEMLELEKKELDARAKKLMWEELKK
jgi:hypothetical protein